MLRGAGVAGATAPGATAPGGTALASGTAAAARTRDDRDDRIGEDLVGSWVVRHRDDAADSPEVTGVVSFAEGGILISQDISPASPTGVGSWTARRRRFRAKFWAGFRGEQPGGPGVTFLVRIGGRVDDDEIAGRYRYVVYDGASGDEVARGTGTFDGVRLEA